MELFRELADGPHRKSTRQRGPKPTKDEGDLYALRASPRKLRVLIDEESLTKTVDALVLRLLEGLLSYDHVEVLRIRMSDIAPETPENWSEEPGYVHVRDITANQGAFGYPGPSYGYQIVGNRRRWDGSTTEQEGGNFSPQPQQVSACHAYADFSVDARKVLTWDDVYRAMLLSETAVAIEYDVVISETLTTGDRRLPSNDRVTVVSREGAVPIIAHYLRRQHQYIVSPAGNRTMNRRGFYQEAVGAIATGIWFWLAKCRLTASEIDPSAKEYVKDCHVVIGRFLRALKARDDLFAAIGAIQTADVADDAAESLDRILLSLCGGIDMLARSLHRALQNSGNERNAKLHVDNGYAALAEAYANNKLRSQVDELQRSLPVVFNLRNTIHNRALQAEASVDINTEGVAPDGIADDFIKVNVGRLDIKIPDHVVDDVLASVGGPATWGARYVGPELYADLGLLVDALISKTFAFADMFCRMISDESIGDKHPVLSESIISAQITPGNAYARNLRLLVGFPRDDVRDVHFEAAW